MVSWSHSCELGMIKYMHNANCMGLYLIASNPLILHRLLIHLQSKATTVPLSNHVLRQ